MPNTDQTSRAAAMRDTLQAAFDAAVDYLDRLDDEPVDAVADLATLRERLDSDLPADGVEPRQVVEDLVEATRGGLMGSSGGRFFGWVIGGAAPAALAADWLTSAWDNNAAMFSCGPAAAAIEEISGRWLKQILALPDHASF